MSLGSHDKSMLGQFSNNKIPMPHQICCYIFIANEHRAIETDSIYIVCQITDNEIKTKRVLISPQQPSHSPWL